MTVHSGVNAMTTHIHCRRLFHVSGLALVMCLTLSACVSSRIVRPATVTPPATVPLIDVDVDNPDGVYKAGQPAVFTIKPTGPVPPAGVTVRYQFIRDGMTTETEGRLTITARPVQLTRTLNRPGWLMLQLAWSGPAAGTSRVGALFDPFKIRPALAAPADFDAYWAKQRALLQGAAQPEVVKVPCAQPQYDLYHVTLPMPVGPPVRGYMSKPKGARPRSLGAIAFTHGAYMPPRSSNVPTTWSMGMIAFDFNAHGHEDAMARDWYVNLGRTELRQYWLRGWEDRDTVYFHNMYLRLMRAVDFLTRQPEWDGRVLCVFGGSQGGAQAIAAAGLDSRVNVVVAGVPALCDLNGYRAGRIDGWPHPTRLGPDGLPLNPKIAATTPYYDSVNFARRIKCPVFMATGLIDRTCQPCTVLAAYNALQSRTKEIVILPKKAHEFSTDPAQRAVAEQFVRAQVARLEKKP